MSLPFSRLRRASVATAIMRDHTIAAQNEVHHLRVPIVRGQRPAVVKDDGLPGAPVLVEDLYTVFSSEAGHRG